MNNNEKNTFDKSDVASFLGVRSPAELKRLNKKEIPELCVRLRRVLIAQTSKGGGHLASNLGAVELTVAIHRVFDSPTDHVIFDVGHQSYVHKLLTGRAEAFDTLRAPGGLSGFPRREESEHDAFGTGHASTSLSAALGLARAEKLKGSDAFTVAVLGDGAFTGGMVHEALNNCERDLRLIVLLNENEMSISKNVGRFARLLTKLRTAPGYSRTKSFLGRLLSRIPLIGRPLKNGLRGIKRGIKRLLYRSNYFEAMGLNYLGPVDGHDERALERILRSAKGKHGCSIVHVKTVKGKGYAPAEQHPDAYHGLPAAGKCSNAPTFSNVFGQTLTSLAERDNRLCAITAAMPDGTGLLPFAAAHPDRFFDVGIAEEHAVTFAAGLAAGGCTPVVAIYSTFLQRAYDQILHDVALQKLPVLFAIDRAGLNAADGLTHHGIYDVAFLSDIPGMTIWHPLTTASLQERLTSLLIDGLTGPTALRYHSGSDDRTIVSYLNSSSVHPVCMGAVADFDIENPPTCVIVTYGRLLTEALSAALEMGENVGIVAAELLRPCTALADALARMAERGTERVVICEEGIRNGGFAMTLSDALTTCAHRGTFPDVRIVAISNDCVTPDAEAGQDVFSAVKIAKKAIVDALKD